MKSYSSSKLLSVIRFHIYEYVACSYQHHPTCFTHDRLMLQDLKQLCPVPCVPGRPPNVSISAGQTRPARVLPHIWSFLQLPGALHYSSFEVFSLADWISEGQSSAAAARFAVIFAEDSLLWDSFPPSCSQSLQETDSSLPLSLRWKWLIQLLLDFFFFFFQE